MAFSRLYYHIVFSTFLRQPSLNPSFERLLLSYFVTVSQSKGVKVIRINCVPDHVHILIRTATDFILKDYVRDIKRSSSYMLRRTKGFEKFNGWNATYAADTVSFHQVEAVRKYIQNQKEHHNFEKYEDELKRIFGIIQEDIESEYRRE